MAQRADTSSSDPGIVAAVTSLLCGRDAAAVASVLGFCSRYAADRAGSRRTDRARSWRRRRLVAIGVLLAFGLYTLLVADVRDAERLANGVATCGVGALVLRIGISLDELAIGFTLGLLRLPAGLVIALIALQAFVVTQLGLRLANKVSERVRGRRLGPVPGPPLEPTRGG